MDFKEIFTREWMENSSSVAHAIETVTRAIKEWKSSFGNIFGEETVIDQKVAGYSKFTSVVYFLLICNN